MPGEIDVSDCTRCETLCVSRSRIVNGTGPTDAELLFVGEAPGRKEDEGGEPFVGRSGEVLDSALRDTGFARSDIRITNGVRCRPPANRAPTAQARENDPNAVEALGTVPAEHLLGRSVGVREAAGSVRRARISGTTRRLVVSVHPAATLYDPSQRETFGTAIAAAVDLVDGGGDQSRLGEF